MVRALIVDDSRTACAILARKLSNFGVESDRCFEGSAALEFLTSNTPDVIFMDHNMPGMDGLEVLKLIKENPDTQDIPVLMYTSNQDADYVEQAKAIGAVDVLPKELGSAYIHQALIKLELLPSEEKPAEPAPVVQIEPQQDDDDTIDLMDQISPKLKHQLYLTTEEMQHTIEEQSTLVVKNLRKEMMNEFIELSQRMDQQGEQLRKVESNSSSAGRWAVAATFAAIVAVGSVFMGSNSSPDQQQELNSALNAIEESLGQQAQIQQEIFQSLENSPQQQIPTRTAVTLFDVAGNEIGSVLSWEEQTGTALVINKNEFLFKVASDGSIRSRVPARYYLSQDCVGDAWIESFPSQVFSAEGESLWYTAKTSTPDYLQPFSILETGGECKRYQGDELALRLLLENDTQVTGVNNSRYEPVAQITTEINKL